jgi:hypothetical protein
MGVFWGLPDFGAPQASSAHEVYAPYEPGPYQLLPSGLRVGELSPGRPDFELTLIRASGAGEDSGVLSLGLRREQDLTGALTFLRGVDPKATVATAPFRSGFIRLAASSGLVDPPADLLTPSPLGWGGLDATRWNLPLSADAATLIKSGLASTLPLTARVEVEVRGIAPRVQSTALFDPSALLAGLVQPGPSRQIPAPVLLDYFRDAPANLKTLTLEGDQSPDREAFAQAMALRVRTQYGRAVPSAGEGPPIVELAADIPTGTTRWNLAEPAAVLRSWAFTLDPFASARALAKTSGVAALCREVTTTPVPLGFFDVDVQAYLPAPRTGLLDVGVVLTVPAHPPFVPQADSHTVRFQAPIDHEVVHIRTSPAARLVYTYTTFADVLEGSDTRRLEGAATSETTTALRLQAGDMPLDLIELSADADLLAIASISGTLSYTSPAGHATSTPFALGTAQPRISVAVPRDATASTLDVDARPLAADGGTPLHLGPLPAGPLHVALASFEQFGRHTVAIDCTFGPNAPGPFAVELIADGRPESTDNIGVQFLTRDSPTATWEYVANSPFRAGYRWRARGSTAWSASAAPGAALHLKAADAPARPSAWDIGGVHVYVAPGDAPGRVRYVPGAPTPQLDSEGRPALMLVDTGTTAVLSLGTRLDLDAAQRNDLEVALLVDLPGADRIDFQPAPVTVGPATLSIADGSGALQPVISAPSLGTPPYNATFSVQLTGDQRTRALAALGGTAGLLKVDYPLTLPPEVAATFDSAPATLVRTTDVASWFPNGAGSAHVQHVGA